LRSSIIDNKFKEGEVVCARVDPGQRLVIRRYNDRIYYCKIQASPGTNELVYFERELMPPAKNKESGEKIQVIK